MKILIEIEAGFVKSVFCSEPENVEVVIRDLDLIGVGAPDPMSEDPSLEILRTGHFAIY